MGTLRQPATGDTTLFPATTCGISCYRRREREASLSNSGSESRACVKSVAESSGASTSASASHLPATHANWKPVVLRIKRKASQSRLDAFFVEKIGTKNLLVQHLKTVGRPEDIKDVLHSFLHDSNYSLLKRKAEERPNLLKHGKKQEKLRSAARKEHEDHTRNARYEQILKSRRRGGDADEDSLLQICHLYDVVQFDSENEINAKTPKLKPAPLGDSTILCHYLPLIREYLPSAAVEIDSDITRSREEDYVYDLYTVDDDLNITVEGTNAYPLMLVDDNDYYDGAVESDYDTDDSNAEDNPLNDYPDEESSEDEDVRDILNESEGSNFQYVNEVAVDEEDYHAGKWGYC